MLEIPDDADAVIVDQVEGKVTLKDVDFSYLPEQKLIEHLNLDVKPGQTIAIVGPTGCGKTTLINLLMRFYDVNAGAVCVEDQDIRHVTRDSLRLNYGMVLQDTWLKAGTIRENICMGKPDATEEEMIAAAKACHAHGFIKRLSGRIRYRDRRRWRKSVSGTEAVDFHCACYALPAADADSG